MKKRLMIFLTGFMLIGLAGVHAAANAQVKSLLQEGLRLYGERQYVRALDIFKQVQRLDPGNERAKEYIQSSQERLLEWENQGGLMEDSNAPAANWDTILNSRSAQGGTENVSNAKDIIAARRSLVERMKNRSVNTDNIVEINDTKRGVSITLYHDQLFLPGLQTLRDEALPILSNVAQLIRTSGERDVTIRSASSSDSKDPFLLFPDFPVPADDPTLPQMTRTDTAFLFQDIESTRAFILFTHIAQRSMVSPDQAFRQ